MIIKTIEQRSKSNPLAHTSSLLVPSYCDKFSDFCLGKKLSIGREMFYDADDMTIPASCPADVEVS